MYFTYTELKCPCCGMSKMDKTFMDRLNKLREDCGFPFKVTSAYRCEKHNKDVGGEPDSAHLQGRAVDVLVQGQQAYELLSKATLYGFTGLGVKQHGDHGSRFIHLDDTAGELRPRIWTYV